MTNKSDEFRDKAANCLHLAEQADSPPAAARFRRMAAAWASLAIEQDWLEGRIAPNERAAELASGTIDRLRQQGVSNADAESRKRTLVGGPAEFRDARVDNGES
jgi:hypothetical protein